LEAGQAERYHNENAGATRAARRLRVQGWVVVQSAMPVQDGTEMNVGTKSRNTTPIAASSYLFIE
jgi:hypothetical protein